MIVSFFHDDRLLRDGEGNIYSNVFPYKVWKRYLAVSDSIIVTTRMKTTNSSHKHLAKNLELSSGPFVSFNPATKFSKNSHLLFNKKQIINQVKETISKSDCAIIRLPSFIGSIACDLAVKLGKPYLIELVGCPWDAFWNHSIKGKMIAPAIYLTTRRQVKNAPWVLYVTDKFLQNRYPTQGKSIGCSDVVIPDTDVLVLKKRLEKIACMQKGKPVILATTAAVDVRYKGQEYVIRAIKKLNEKGGNFEYKLAGGGDQSYLRRLAERCGVADKVHFLGTLTHEQVFAYLDEIDIYIQASKQEGLPRALVEAQSRGCPAIGSRTGGIPELIQEKLIFRNGSVQEIINLLANFSKADLHETAKINYSKAKEYNADSLENKRNSFYQLFADSIR